MQLLGLPERLVRDEVVRLDHGAGVELDVRPRLVVRAVVRLPRVRLLVLAGSIMGGEITKAVDEVREKGLIVISLNMAGSLPDAADLVVSDPVQAGVMAVMAIADTAKFNIVRQQKRRY